ncbi:MAG: VCBS repeat-containing protein, partial [Sediminibacterium sp.]
MKRIVFAFGILLSLQSFSQQVLSKLSTQGFNLKVPILNVAEGAGTRIISSLGGILYYKTNGIENIVAVPLYPPDSTQKSTPYYHFIKKASNWEYENYYNIGKLIGVDGNSLDSNGNFAFSSTGDDCKTFGGQVVFGKTINNKLELQQVSTYEECYRHIAFGDLNLDGKVDLITDGGKEPDNLLSPFIQKSDGKFVQTPELMPKIPAWSPQLDQVKYSYLSQGFNVGIANAFGGKFPEIYKGQYGNNVEARYVIAIHVFNEKTGIYDTVRVLKDQGVYKDNGKGIINLAFADVNNDGKLDMITGYFQSVNWGYGSIGVQVFINDSLDNFKAGQHIEFKRVGVPQSLTDTTWELNFKDFILEDVNNDGWKDLIFSPLLSRDYCINQTYSFGNPGDGIRLNSSIYLNNKGTFEKLKTELNFPGSWPYYVRPALIDKKLKFIGFGFPLGGGGNPLVSYDSFGKLFYPAPDSVTLYEITVNFCNNLTKPAFNTTKYSFCTGDSLKLTVSNINKGDTLKWYYGSKSDLTNLSNKTFTDSTKLFVTRTDSSGCVISSDTVQIKKYSIPSAPTLSRDTANFLLSGAAGTTWYKDGSAITDTAQKYKPTAAGSYTAKTTINGCTSVMSAAYYYLVTDIINLSKDEFIKLAPNPFVNQLNFDFVVKGYQKLNIEVFD